MKKLILLIVCHFAAVALLYSQSQGCKKILNDAQKAFDEKHYEEADHKLDLLDQCDDKRVFEKDRNKLQDKIFAAIKKQAYDANIAKNNAEKAEKQAIKEREKSDSLKIEQYNKSVAYNKIQEDPTLAWNIAHTIDPNSNNMRDIVFSITNEDKNSFYKKSFNLKSKILALGWQKEGDEKNFLLTATANGILSYWNTEGDLMDTFRFSNRSNIAEISKDGRSMMCTNFDSSLMLWHLERKEKIVLKKLSESAVSYMAVSNNNAYWAAAFNDHVEVYDSTGGFLNKFELDKKPNSVAVSNAHILLIGFNDQPAQFFDIKRGIKTFTDKKYLSNLRISNAYFTDFTNNNNRNSVFIAYQNAMAQLTNLSIEKNYKVLGHSNTITAVAATADPYYLATAGRDKIICIWQNYSDHYQRFAFLKGHDETINHIAFSKDAQFIASSTANNVKIWLTNVRTISKTVENDVPFSSMTYLLNSKDSVLTGDESGQIRLINSKGKIVKTWKHSVNKITSLVTYYNPNTMDTLFLSGSSDGSVSIWHPRKDKPDTTINYDNNGVTAEVRSIVMYNRGKEFFTAYADGSIFHRKIKGDSIFLFSNDNISKMCIFEDNLFIAYENGLLKQLNVKSYNSQTLGKVDTSIQALAVSHNGRYVLTSSAHNIKIWDIKNLRNSKDFPNAHTNDITDLKFSADDKYCFSVGDDRSVFMWTLDGQKLYKVSNYLNASMTLLDVSSNENSFVTASNIIQFWHTPQSLMAENIEKIKPEQIEDILMPVNFYQKTMDFNVLKKSAKKYAEAKSLEQANVLYELTMASILDSLKKESDTNIIAKLNESRRAINIERITFSYDPKEAFIKLINTCRDTEDVAYYSQYFFEQRMWPELQCASSKYQKLAKSSNMLNKTYLYITYVELSDEHNRNWLANDFKNLTDLEDILTLRNFFADLSSNTSDKNIRQKVEYAKLAFIMSQKQFQLYSQAISLDMTAIDNINYHWCLIQKGDMAEAKSVIEDGFALLKDRKLSEGLMGLYKLMQMNYGHTLLFSGQIQEAYDLILSLIDSPFVDNRFRTFREAYLDDFSAIEGFDTIQPGIKVIPIRYRDDYLNIKAALKNQQLDKNPPNKSSDKRPTEGVVIASKNVQKRYFVIVGSEKIEKDAEEKVAQFDKIGVHNLKIMPLYDGLYRISAFNTTNKKEAEDYKKKLDLGLKIKAEIYEEKF